ncbi:hypothetical protein BH10ACI3_BH10ACI3_22970 [soil metagenome]
MKRYITPIFVIAFAAVALFLIDGGRPQAQTTPKPDGAQVQKMPEVLILDTLGKMGKVTFNHVKHNGGEYKVSGPIACIECHHTAQPASQLAKYPPLETAWPKDRTTTLTIELFAKDPKAAGVAACRDCHARAGEKPKLLPEIPVLKDPGSTTLTKLTNQMAFHQTCDVCHFQISFNRPDSKVPNATSCKSCHKRDA